MNNGYTHLVSFEKYNKFFRAWIAGSFRTVKQNVASYEKIMSAKNYRNVKIEAI